MYSVQETGDRRPGREKVEEWESPSRFQRPIFVFVTLSQRHNERRTTDVQHFYK